MSALPVYQAPMNYGGNSGGWNNGWNNGGMDNGAGGTGWDGEIIPHAGPRGPVIGQSSSSYIGAEAGEGNGYISSSESDYDSTPSDGGGDHNPTAPTLPPGGDPTTRKHQCLLID